MLHRLERIYNVRAGRCVRGGLKKGLRASSTCLHVCVSRYCLLVRSESLPTLSMWSSTSCWEQLSIFCSTFLTDASTSTMLSLVMLVERVERLECKQQLSLFGTTAVWKPHLHYNVTDALCQGFYIFHDATCRGYFVDTGECLLTVCGGLWLSEPPHTHTPPPPPTQLKHVSAFVMLKSTGCNGVENISTHLILGKWLSVMKRRILMRGNKIQYYTAIFTLFQIDSRTLKWFLSPHCFSNGAYFAFRKISSGGITLGFLAARRAYCEPTVYQMFVLLNHYQLISRQMWAQISDCLQPFISVTKDRK